MKDLHLVIHIYLDEVRAYNLYSYLMENKKIDLKSVPWKTIAFWTIFHSFSDRVGYMCIYNPTVHHTVHITFEIYTK